MIATKRFHALLPLAADFLSFAAACALPFPACSGLQS